MTKLPPFLKQYSLSLFFAAIWFFRLNSELLAGDLSVDPDPARIREIAALLDAKPSGLGEPISNRSAWEALAAKYPSRGDLLSDATRYLAEPTPELTDDMYLEFSRTGNRNRYSDPCDRRRLRLVKWVLAECFENKGRFLTAIEKEVEAICSEKSWVFPSHDQKLVNFKGIKIENDLGSAMTAWTLATADWMLQDKLSPPVKKLIRDETRRRVFNPFLDQVHNKSPSEWWRTSLYNWNIVVHSGIVGAALSLTDSVEERAEMIAAAEKGAKLYLQGFKKDGYCGEGLGYWNYGFGHYVLFAESVLRATHGKLNFYNDDRARAVMLYPRHLQIISNVYPAFADCAIGEKPADWILAIVEKRAGFETAFQKTPPLSDMYSALLYAWGIHWFSDNFPASAENKGSLAKGLALRDWFEESQVYIGRPSSENGFGVAFKGGNNGESHGHNDLGTYVVVKGKESVLLDPGLVNYTANTFGPKRYENSLLNSYGHAVPLVAGQLQKTGATYLSTVLEKKFADAGDSITLDLTLAYGVPELQQLTRRMDYTRGGAGEMTITDQVIFKSPQTFGTALITYGVAKELSPTVYLIQQKNESVQVTIETQGIPFQINNEILKDVTKSGQKVRRLGINLLQPVSKAMIEIKIVPVPAPSP